MATGAILQDRSQTPRKAARLKIATRLAPEPLAIETKDAARRYGWLFGSFFAACISALTHCTLLLVLAVVVVDDQSKPVPIQIVSRKPVYHDELVELTVDRIELAALPVERPEFQTSDSAAGNETDAGDIGGALDEAPSLEPSEVAGATGLLDSDLRKALLSGLGGPGAESGSANSGGTFASLIADAQEHGLEIVIVMDSTGSMGGEIETVKKKILAIGGALLVKVPDARLSIVSYKDREEEYVVKGLPLTSDMEEVQAFLKHIKAGGGGDPPEAVEAGLQWAILNNEYRHRARKVILLFGDQPPHDSDVSQCISLAAQFRFAQEGTVSTITCRKGAPIPCFYEIARAGGGEPLLLKDSRRIMEELLVLAFGSRHRKDVVEFFGLDALAEPPPVGRPANVVPPAAPKRPPRRR